MRLHFIFLVKDSDCGYDDSRHLLSNMSSISIVHLFGFLLWDLVTDIGSSAIFLCVCARPQLMTIIDWTINNTSIVECICICACVSQLLANKIQATTIILNDKNERMNEKLKTTKHRTMTWRHFLWASKWKSYHRHFLLLRSCGGCLHNFKVKV